MVETPDKDIRVLGVISILGEMKSSCDIGYNFQIFALDTKIQDPRDKCFRENKESV